MHKFVNNLAGAMDGDPLVRGRMKVIFLSSYNVTLAEHLIPAADVSNQISTVGYEASGTSNMKFMRNGALKPGAFAPIRNTMLTQGDHYLHLADLTSYTQAQDRLGTLYCDRGKWARKAILNVAGSGKFSSDRTIHEYATEIWKAEPCPIS